MNSSRFVTTALSVFLLCSYALAQTVSAWSPHTGIPPIELAARDQAYSKLVFTETGVQGRATYDMIGRKLLIRWTGTNPSVSTTQSIAVPFWPTALRSTSDMSRLVVAGKRRQGNTVMELWTIQSPRPARIQDPTTGATLDTLTPAEVLSVDTLYDAAVEGQDLISDVLLSLASSTKLYVRYWDSAALFELDFSSLASVSQLKRAAPTPVAGGLQAPGLLQQIENAYSAEHIVHGYVYVFSGQLGANSSIVILEDGNRDGVLDSVTEIPSLQWPPEWSKSANYVPH